jgi:hypothetical protein
MAFRLSRAKSQGLRAYEVRLRCVQTAIQWFHGGERGGGTEVYKSLLHRSSQLRPGSQHFFVHSQNIARRYLMSSRRLLSKIPYSFHLCVSRIQAPRYSILGSSPKIDIRVVGDRNAMPKGLIHVCGEQTSHMCRR